MTTRNQLHMISTWRTITSSIHHLFFATFALGCGICLQAWYSPLPTVAPLLVMALSAIIITLSFVQKGRKILWILVPAAFLCGALRYQAQQAEANLLYDVHTGYHETLVGTVTEKEAIQHPYLRERITLSLNNSPETLLYVFTPQRIPVKQGDTLQLNQIVISPNTNSDYKTYLTREGITFSIFLKQNHPYKILNLNKGSLGQSIARERTRMLLSLRKKLSKKTFTLFTALFLGYKHTTKQDLTDYKNIFKNLGILHYLARSGLHLVIIIMLLQFLLRGIPCSFTIKQLFMTAFIIVYHLLSWSSISFMRALVTFFLFSWCVVARWQSNFLHLLTITCFFTLIFNPLQLFALDFQLSYGMTYALAFMSFSPKPKS